MYATEADGNVEGEGGGYLYFIVIVSRPNASRRCLSQRNEIVDQQNFISSHVHTSPRSVYNRAASLIASLIPPS